MSGNALSRESVRWLMLEGMAIVVSILLAFWLNAWWDNHQKRGEERLLLESISSELEAIRHAASRDLSSAKAIRKNVSRLIEISYGAELADGEDIFQVLGDSLWRNSPVTYSAPVLSAAVAGGNISILSNAELRLRLISWETRLKDTQYVVEHDSHNLSERQIPAFAQRDLLVAALSRSLCMPGNPGLCTEVPVQVSEHNFPDEPERLLDANLRGVLVEREISLLDEIDFALVGLGGDLSKVIQDIEVELKKY